MRVVPGVCGLIMAGLLAVAPVRAQKEFEVYTRMQAMSEALGVTCGHCHVPTGVNRWDFKADGNPKKAIARKMLDMTADINARVFLATGSEAARDGQQAVTCVSCHRGVPVPSTIAQIVERAIEEDGPEAAVARYRALRARFYEKDVYDFSEAELLRLARHYVSSRPEAAIALAQMNLEWRPASASSYVVMAFAYTRKLDDAAAIPLLRKALELDPDNGAARGYLLKLEEFANLKEGQ